MRLWAARCEGVGDVVSEFDAVDCAPPNPSDRSSSWPGAVSGGVGPVPRGGDDAYPRVNLDRQARYAWRAVLTDLAILVAVTALAIGSGFGNSSDNHSLATLVAGGTAICLTAGLAAARSWEPALLGQRTAEIRRLCLSGSASRA
jgi:hypothetical protein